MMLLLTDLPGDLHEPIARWLTVSDVGSLRATCRDLHASYLLLRRHPSLGSLVAVFTCDTDQLRAIGHLVPLVSRLVRVHGLTRELCTTIGDAGFHRLGSAAAADVLASVAVHDRPDMLPTVMFLVSGDHFVVCPHLPLWTTGTGNNGVVYRMARIYEYLEEGQNEKEIMAAMVDRHAPRLGQGPDDMNALALICGLQNAKSDDKVVAACAALHRYVEMDPATLDACQLCPYLVALLAHPNPDIAYEAVRLLGHMPPGSSCSPWVMAQLGALPLLMQLLEPGCGARTDKVLVTFALFLRDGPECQALLMEAGFIECAGRLVTAESVAAASADGTLDENDPITRLSDMLEILTSHWSDAHNPRLPVLVPMLVTLLRYSRTDRHLRRAARSLGHLAVIDNSAWISLLLLDHGAAMALVSVLFQYPPTDPPTRRPMLAVLISLFALERVVGQSTALCSQALDAGYLDIAPALLQQGQNLIIAATLAVLAAVTADKQRLVASGLMPLVTMQLLNPALTNHDLAKSVHLLKCIVDSQCDPDIPPLLAGDDTNGMVRCLIAALTTPGIRAERLAVATRALVRLVRHDPSLCGIANAILDESKALDVESNEMVELYRVLGRVPS
ncbi:hypothetical protein BC828DRAFT_391368 [Blastocladiella britannica]|nr:hypothetical protein BC828DRAFT_391368 [Blastocladiella britannica]